MANYDLYNTRINSYSDNLRDRMVIKAQEEIKRKLNSHPNLRDVKIGEEQRSIVVISKDRMGNSLKDVKQILSLPNESFEVGQYVEFQNNTWLISQADVDDELYIDGQMVLCNNVLKFQDTNGEIYSYPYFVDNSLPSLDENKVITVSSTNRKIKIPLDVLTRDFFIDKRFIGETFNDMPQCWKIVDLDGQSSRGLLIVSLEKDQYDENKDNLELGIADYFESTIPSPQPTVGDCEITYLGLPEVKIGGSFKAFYAVFRDVNGVILTDVKAVWNTVISPEFQEFFVIQSNDNSISIKAVNNLSLMGANIKLILENEDATYHTELLIEVVSGI